MEFTRKQRGMIKESVAILRRRDEKFDYIRA